MEENTDFLRRRNGGDTESAESTDPTEVYNLTKLTKSDSTYKSIIKSDLFERFDRLWPTTIWWDVPIVLGVSGGADSILLAELVYRARLCEERRLTKQFDRTGKDFRTANVRVIIAHANHQLRGAESDGDEQFVRDWYESRKSASWLAFRSTRLEIETTANGLESDCRAARYGWLERVCSEFGARYLLTAHNSDDQAETILYRVLRGTGMDGLSGIPMFRRISESLTLARPILSFSRREIESQLNAWGLSWRTDSSNLTNDYSRNQIRNQLLPWIEQNVQPSVRQSLLRLGNLARQAQEAIQRQIDDLNRRGATISRPETLDFFCNSLENVSEYVVSELIRDAWEKQGWPQQAMGRSEWDQLVQLVRNPSERAARMFPGKIQALRLSDRLRLRKLF